MFDGVKRRIAERFEEHKAARAKGQSQLPMRPLAAFHNAVKAPRKLACRAESGGASAASSSCGTLHLSILGGKYQTRRAYWVAELDGNERRTSTALCDTPVWEGQNFEFPVYDPSSDLRLMLFDDESINNEKSIGRVIIPLPSLYTANGVFGAGVGALSTGGGQNTSRTAVGTSPSSSPASSPSVLSSLVPRVPAGTRRVTLQVTPIGPQHSEQSDRRFDEAIPGMPGSGIVKPRKDIGTIEVLLRLDFHPTPLTDSLGLLAVYANAEESSASAVRKENADGDDDEEGGGYELLGEGHNKETDTDGLPPKLNIRLLKLHLLRLSRFLGKPYLLQGLPCLALPFVWFAACFYIPVCLLPWVVGGLGVANGVVDRLHRHETVSKFIFWESEVGEDELRKHPLRKLKQLQRILVKLQHGLGILVTALEKLQNLFNSSDPTVTAAAMCLLGIVCFVSSLVLLLIPISVLVFSCGMVGLWPFLVDALCTVDIISKKGQTQGDQQEQQQQQHNSSSASSSARTTSSSSSSRQSTTGNLPSPLAMLRNVFARVPDGRDVAHRYFAAQQVLKVEEVVRDVDGDDTSDHPWPVAAKKDE